MSKTKEKVIVIRETNFQSYVADTFTFASMCGSFWFNYKFIGGNHTFDVLLFISFFLFSLGRAKDIIRAIENAKKNDERVN